MSCYESRHEVRSVLTLGNGNRSDNQRNRSISDEERLGSHRTTVRSQLDVAMDELTKRQNISGTSEMSVIRFRLRNCLSMQAASAVSFLAQNAVLLPLPSTAAL